MVGELLGTLLDFLPLRISDYAYAPPARFGGPRTLLSIIPFLQPMLPLPESDALLYAMKKRVSRLYWTNNRRFWVSDSG